MLHEYQRRHEEIPCHHTAMGEVCVQQNADGIKDFGGRFPKRVEHAVSDHAKRPSIH